MSVASTQASFSVTVATVAQALGLTEERIQGLCREGQLPALQVCPGGRWRIRSDWQDVLQARNALTTERAMDRSRADSIRRAKQRNARAADLRAQRFGPRSANG